MAHSEVIIVGGGVMGLGLARALAKAGKKVSLFEAGPLGREASFASAGMIGPQSEAMEDDAYFAATIVSRDLWPGFAAELAAESGMDLHYHPRGALHLAFGAGYERRLEAKYLWQKTRSGQVEKLGREALLKRWPYLHPRVSAGYLASGDQWVDNEALVAALEAACRKLGVALHEHCPVEPLTAEGGAVKGVRAAGQMHGAGAVVVAAGAWSGQVLGGLLGPKPAFVPVRGQVLSFVAPPELMPDLPIHAENIYLVPRHGNRVIAGATVEYKGFEKDVTGEGLEYLLQNAFETIPDLRPCPVDRSWAGLRPGSDDGWPTLGPTPIANLFLACGHFRRGILFAPLTILRVGEAVLGQPLAADVQAFGFGRHAKAAHAG